jgi:hypothetical protein
VLGVIGGFQKLEADAKDLPKDSQEQQQTRQYRQSFLTDLGELKHEKHTMPLKASCAMLFSVAIVIGTVYCDDVRHAQHIFSIRWNLVSIPTMLLVR